MLQLNNLFRITNTINSFKLLTLSNVSTTNNDFWRFFDVPYAGYNSRSREEKLGLPAKPKKPLTPYFRYMVEMRPQVKAKNPKLPLTEIVRICAEKWRAIDENKRKQLEEQFKKDQVKYIEEHAKYETKLSDEQKLAIQQLKHDIKIAKEKRLLRKRIRAFDKPIKPASSFLLFLSDQRKKVPLGKNEVFKDWQAKITAKWRNLSDQDKQQFVDISRNNLETYRSAMRLWEEKMIKLGNLDLVRNESLIAREKPVTNESSPRPSSIKLQHKKNVDLE